MGDVREALQFIVGELETGDTGHAVVADIALLLTVLDVHGLVSQSAESGFQIIFNIIAFQTIFGNGVEFKTPIHVVQRSTHVVFQVKSFGATGTVVGSLISFTMGDSPNRIRHASLRRTEEVPRTALSTRIKGGVFSTVFECSLHTLVHGLVFIERRVLTPHDVINGQGLEEVGGQRSPG
jgi:hypothetical protein